MPTNPGGSVANHAHLIPNAHSLVSVQVRYIINNLAATNVKDSVTELQNVSNFYILGLFR